MTLKKKMTGVFPGVTNHVATRGGVWTKNSAVIGQQPQRTHFCLKAKTGFNDV